jgi:pimeloyl-ACP methyl ester carboxylesterase
MKKQKSKFKRVSKGIGILFGVLVLLLYLGLPAAMGVYTVLPGRDAVGSPPETFEEVVLQTEDGVQLQGWYRPPTNGAAIILIHGAGSSRESLRSYAQMLVEHGYGVLALDLRGHGQSEGKTNRLGWQGTQEVGAAVNYLQGRGEVQRIGGLGISLGGEVLLGAAAHYPEIRAIAADGATRRCTSELLALESERPLVRNFTARVMYAAVQVLTGDAPPRPLLDSMIASKSTQFFLIAAGKNALETAFNQMFAATLGSRASLWIAPQADHTTAFTLYPQEYKQRVISFFQTGLKE